MRKPAKLTCAIYTRKSTEDGLEQNFNSLDAQREACEAYIASQAGLGWKGLGDRYDDAGISGGHMDRPGLQQLLEDVRGGKVKIVVVYKIDRLTRSLMDFARMVEIFDEHDVSFVSVTQQFNTTTSMGRLTLNVLLSFAQFEREVTAERIRDKIAASRKKGIWMGGWAPLGYDVEDKKMIINPQEAETVRHIFKLYLELNCVRKLKQRCDELGIVTKLRQFRNGKVQGGKAFSRGNLYELLSNPIYIGKVRHKEQIYDGQHQAILDDRLWQEVRDLLAQNAARRKNSENAKSPSLLTGLVFDETGDKLSPTHAIKNGRRYRYYISHRLMHDKRDGNNGWRIPATELENRIISAMSQILNDEVQLLEMIQSGENKIQLIKFLKEKTTNLVHLLASGDAQQRRMLIHGLVKQIRLSDSQLTIDLSKHELRSQLLPPDYLRPTPIEGSDIYSITLPFTLRRRGVEAKLILGLKEEREVCVDDNLVRTIANAHAWFDALSKGQACSIQHLAETQGVDTNDISRSLQLAFLAPGIVEQVLAGKQPVELTSQTLKRVGDLPLCWHRQIVQLGCA